MATDLWNSELYDDKHSFVWKLGASVVELLAPQSSERILDVFVGIRGKGKLTADGEMFDVGANSVVFVRAGVEHHFYDVTDDLTVLVFFAGAKQ